MDEFAYDRFSGFGALLSSGCGPTGAEEMADL